MSTDARFDRIQKILPHDNADALEIAMVSGFPCVVRKGEFKAGDTVFYIRDDAKLTQAEEYLEWSRELREHPDAIGPLEFIWSFPWQESLVKYLGSGARVKSVKLRNRISMGILLRPETVCIDDLTKFYLETEHFDELNLKITDPKHGEKFLAEHFGVGHWTAPLSSHLGTINARGQLISGLWKTDEENFQNIDDSLFPWNEIVLVTKKLDGSSCSISSSPDGDVHVMSRSLDLNLDDDNIWNRAAKPVIPLVKELAKYFNDTIVIRGEVTGSGINSSRANLDAKGEPTFNMFAVAFPYMFDNEEGRIGLYGSNFHFLKVNEICMKITGEMIKTVPVEGEKILTRKLLEYYVNLPKEDGEGRVINTKSINLPHFKAKSIDYLCCLGK